jgi:hypothetical protein
VHDPGDTRLKFYHEMVNALFEATLAATKKTAVTVRLEQVQKSGDDLGFLTDDLTQLFTIQAASLAVTRDVLSSGGYTFALGARGSIDRLPETLRLTYRTVTPAGYAIFLKIR